MSTSRRQLLASAAASAAALALPTRSLLAALPNDLAAAPVAEGDWDMSWVGKLTGAHRALFDCTEIESGYGVWRANAWAGQYMDVLKATPASLSPVIVLRHNAIALAMQQSFWDKYKVGAKTKAKHPLTEQPTAKNPALLDEKDGIPAPFNNAALHKQLGRGVIALACNLALQDCIGLVKKVDKVGDEAARKVAVAALVPGVILMPSGVFAAVRAQQAGCAYVKAS